MANWWDDWKVPESVTTPSPTLPTPGGGAQALLPSATPLAPSLPNPPSFADTLAQYRAQQQQDVEKWLRPASTQTPSFRVPPQPASTWQTLKDIGGGVLETIRGIPAVVGSSMESIANPYAERDWKDSVIESGRQRQQADLQALRDAGEYDRPMGLGMPFTRGEWAENTQSFPYTAATMLPALAVGAVGGAIGGAIGGLGGPAAPATVPAGAATGRVIGETLGGMLGSYFPAGGAAANQFIRDSLDKYQQDFTKKSGREPTPEEIDAYYKTTVEPQAIRVYHGESAPEAIGTVAELGLMKSAIGDILHGGGSLPVRIAKSGAKTALSAFGVEPATETLTQQIQQPAYAATGLTDEAPRSITSLEDWLKSAGEVYKQAASTSLFFSALGIPAGAVYGRYQNRREGNARVDQATSATDTLRANLDVANEQDIAQALAGFDQVEAQGPLPKAAAARLEQARQQLTQELALRASPEALAEPLETARGRAGYLGLAERVDSLSDEQLAQAASRPLPQDVDTEIANAHKMYGAALAQRQQLAQVADQLQDPEAAKIMASTLGRITSGKPMVQGGYGSVDFNLASLSDDMLERYRQTAEVLARAEKPSQTVTKAADALNQEAQRRAAGQRRDPESIRLSETVSKIALAPEAKMAAMLKGLSTEGLDRIASRLNELATANPLLADKARAVLERVRADRMRQFNPQGEQQSADVQAALRARLQGWNAGQPVPISMADSIAADRARLSELAQQAELQSRQNSILDQEDRRRVALEAEISALNSRRSALPTPPAQTPLVPTSIGRPIGHLGTTQLGRPWSELLPVLNQPSHLDPSQAQLEGGLPSPFQPVPNSLALHRVLQTQVARRQQERARQNQRAFEDQARSGPLGSLMGLRQSFESERPSLPPPSGQTQTAPTVGPAFAPPAPTPRLPTPPNVQTRQTAQQAAPSVGVPTGPEGARGARPEGTGTKSNGKANEIKGLSDAELTDAANKIAQARTNAQTLKTIRKQRKAKEAEETRKAIDSDQIERNVHDQKAAKQTLREYLSDRHIPAVVEKIMNASPGVGGRRIDQKTGATIAVGGSSTVDHYRAVKRAIAEGNPVPADVLADYPDLASAVRGGPTGREISPTTATPSQPETSNAQERKAQAAPLLKQEQPPASTGAVPTPAKKPSRASRPAPSWNDSTRAEREEILKATGASDEFAQRKANEWTTWDAIPEGPIKKRIRDVLADRAEEAAAPADRERDKAPSNTAPNLMESKEKETDKSGDIIPYTKELVIKNMNVVAAGTGARYLEVMRGENGELVAKQWRRKIVPGAILVDFQARPPTVQPSQESPASTKATSTAPPSKAIETPTPAPQPQPKQETPNESIVRSGKDRQGISGPGIQPGGGTAKSVGYGSPVQRPLFGQPRPISDLIAEGFAQPVESVEGLLSQYDETTTDGKTVSRIEINTDTVQTHLDAMDAALGDTLPGMEERPRLEKDLSVIPADQEEQDDDLPGGAWIATLSRNPNLSVRITTVEVDEASELASPPLGVPLIYGQTTDQKDISLYTMEGGPVKFGLVDAIEQANAILKTRWSALADKIGQANTSAEQTLDRYFSDPTAKAVYILRTKDGQALTWSQSRRDMERRIDPENPAYADATVERMTAQAWRDRKTAPTVPAPKAAVPAWAQAAATLVDEQRDAYENAIRNLSENEKILTATNDALRGVRRGTQASKALSKEFNDALRAKESYDRLITRFELASLALDESVPEWKRVVAAMRLFSLTREGEKVGFLSEPPKVENYPADLREKFAVLAKEANGGKVFSKQTLERVAQRFVRPSSVPEYDFARSTLRNSWPNDEFARTIRIENRANLFAPIAEERAIKPLQAMIENVREDVLDHDIHQLIRDANSARIRALGDETTVPEFEAEMDALVDRGKEILKEREAEAKRRAEQEEKDNAAQRDEQAALVARWEAPLPEKTKDANGNKITIEYPTGVGPVRLVPVPLKVKQSDSPIKDLATVAAKDDLRYYLTNVHVDSKNVVATNGHILVAVPNSSAIEEGFYDPKTLAKNESAADWKYPDYERVIPNDKDASTTTRGVLLDELIAIVNAAVRARSFLAEKSQREDATSFVLRVSGIPEKIGFDAKLMLQALSALKAATGAETVTVRTSSKNKDLIAIKITDEKSGALAVIMPLRVSTDNFTYVPIDLKGLTHEDRRSIPSTATTNPATVAQARATLVQALGEKHVTAMERAGRLMLHEKDPTQTGAAGYVDGKGAIHLIPANMDQTALDVALHEAMHLARDDRFSEGERAKVRLAHAALRLIGLKNFIGNPGFNDLVQQVRRMAAEGNKTAQDALAKARLEDPNNIDEEAIAYLAQYADEKLPLVRRVLAAIRAALYRMGIKVNLTPADVRALALSALKNQARRAANAVQMEANARQEAFSLPDFAPTEADKAEVERQMKAVKEVRDDQGRLLAPNGKPSKLNERQWRQVRTQFFKDWFGDWENDPANASKVVDKNGEPLVVYHGTHADIGAFKPNPALGGLIFTSTSKEEANAFTGGKGSNLMPVFLNARKAWPRVVMAYDEGKTAEKAIQKGYDAVLVRDDIKSAINWAVFDPTQIKSALGNAGTFSPRSNRIDYSQPTTEADAAEQARLWAEFQAVRAQFQARQPSETAFKRWFGKGTEGITARDGQPITLYHGTNNPEFNRWDEGRAGQASDHPTAGLGFFMTADRRSAKRYGSRLLELHARINQPYYMTDADLTSIETVQDATRFRKKLLDQGYDGAVITAPGGAPYVVALESKQVKYITNENPTDSEDFRFSMPKKEGTTEWANDLYARRIVPEGWYVHGRASSQNLRNDAVIQLTKSWEIAKQYGFKTGSLWLVKPKPTASVMDFSNTETEDAKRVADMAWEDWQDGTLPFKDDIIASLGEEVSEERFKDEIKELLSPKNIVDNAAIYDADSDWISWLYDRAGIEFAITPDGAVAVDNQAIDAIRVDKSVSLRYSRPGRPSLAHPREAAKVLGDIGELRDTLKPGEKLLAKLNPANWRKMLADLKVNTRPQWLGLLTQDHLLELARTQLPRDAVRQFDDASEKLDAYENRMIQSEGWPLADRWQTLARQARAQSDALGRALYMSTWLGVDPRAASAPKGKQVEWTRAKAALAALTHPEARQLYDDVLKFYEGQTERLFKELEARIQRHTMPDPDKVAARDLLRQEFERIKQEGPYAPLMRFGDLTVWADPIKPGEKPIFATLETVQDQRAFADWLKREGYQPRLGVKMEEITKRALPAGDVVGKLAGLVDKNVKGPQADVLKDAMYQLFLRSLPEQAIRKHFIHRKFVPGYSGDALRTFATFSRRSAKQIARLAHGDRMGSALDDMAKAVREGTVDDSVAAGHLVNELDQSYQWTMNPQTADWASRLTHLGFMFHLAGSPAHLLLNLSQQAQVTIPWLAGELHGKKGFVGVAAALGKANLDFLRTNPFTDPAKRGQHAKTMRAQIEGEYGGDLGKALKVLEEAGKTDKSQTYSISGMSSEDQFLWSKPWLRKSTAALGWFFHASEVINREATAIATYRLGRDAGMSHDAAYDLARRAINETHFDYSPSNRARFMRGNVAKVITLFKQYSLNVSWQFGRNAVLAMRGASAEEKSVARTKLAGMLGMTALMAGAIGMPFYNELAWMLTQLMTAFGDDDQPEWDFDTWFRKMLDHALTPKGSEAVRRGLINVLTGFDVSSRVKLDDLWWRRLDDDLHGKQYAYAAMEQALGPVAGLAVRSLSTVDGLYDALIEGTSARGASARTLEATLPTVLKSISKSLRFAHEGATTATGAPLVSREELGIGGIIGQGIGFTPAALTERQAKNTAMLALQDKIERRRRAILDTINLAVWQGDGDVIAALQDDIQQFNKRYPSDAITGDTIQKSIEAGARRRLELQLFGGAPLHKKLAPMLLSGERGE